MCNTCGCNVTEGNKHLLSEITVSHATKDGHSHAHSHDGGEPHTHGNDHEHTHAVDVLKSLLDHNDRHADINRARLDRHKILTVNLMSSPGSGKTALLEATIKALGGKLRLGVIEGDLETENDADRIRALGVKAHQITTGTACHLDAHLVDQALDHLELNEIDVLFIENVGNLVCPASFDLGHHLNVTLLSVTEGDDKPAKYPVMFRAADLLVLSKTDLLPYLEEFSVDRAESCFRKLASGAEVLEVSAKTGKGIAEWLVWLESKRAAYLDVLAKRDQFSPRLRSPARAQV
jgi:hydrogenase nickel incorporation protein HypB